MAEFDNLQLIKQRNIELEEQLRVCLEDNKRKDDHIKALSSMEIKRGASPGDICIESKAEVSSLQLQLSFLQEKLNESENLGRYKDRELEELRNNVRGFQENVNVMTVKIEELQAQVRTAETLLEENNCANSRSEVAIESLQKLLNDANMRSADLEAQIKSSEFGGGSEAIESGKSLSRTSSDMVNKLPIRFTSPSNGSWHGLGSVDMSKLFKNIEINNSLMKQSKDNLACNVDQFYKDLTEHLQIESDSDPSIVLSKVKQLTSDNNLARGEIENLRSQAGKREQKYLETRETLRAMTNTFDKDKGDLEEFIRAKREFIFEIDKVKLENKTLEQKNGELENKLFEVEKWLKDSRRILDEKEALLSKIDLEKRETCYNASNINREFDGFRETLSGLLGSSFKHCPINEESIKERVKKLVNETKEKDHTIRDLEERLKGISNQFERNLENTKESDGKARRIELEYLDLKDRIRQLEKELSTRDVSRDELRADKEKFYHFLRRLASILKMDPYSKEHDTSLIFDGILERTVQVIQKENDRNLDTNETIISLKKRVRNLKDQIHSRDLHLELMRKKMTNQDDQIRGAFEEVEHRMDAFDREETTIQKLAKMQKKVDQLRDENKALKAELFECSDAKIALNNQSKEIETLQHTLSKLERIRQRQAERIADLSKNVEVCDAETNQTKLISENAVQSLSSELRTMRNALDRARKSEQEMLDFRKVVGRILGLNVDDLAIPNYDIIRRLERLVSVPTSGITMAVPVHHYSIKSGYEDASRLLGRKRRSPHRKLYGDHVRPQSVSPIHDLVDKRKY